MAVTLRTPASCSLKSIRSDSLWAFSSAISPRKASATFAFFSTSAACTSSAAIFSSHSATCFSQSAPAKAITSCWSFAACCFLMSSWAFGSSYVSAPHASPAISACLSLRQTARSGLHLIRSDTGYRCVTKWSIVSPACRVSERVAPSIIRLSMPYGRMERLNYEYPGARIA